jgi:hypothetical protein
LQSGRLTVDRPLLILAALDLALDLDHERLLSPCQKEPEASEW